MSRFAPFSTFRRHLAWFLVRMAASIGPADSQSRAIEGQGSPTSNDPKPPSRPLDTSPATPAPASPPARRAPAAPKKSSEELVLGYLQRNPLRVEICAVSIVASIKSQLPAMDRTMLETDIDDVLRRLVASDRLKAVRKAVPKKGFTIWCRVSE